MRLIRLSGNQQTVKTSNMVSRIKLLYLTSLTIISTNLLFVLNNSPVCGFDSLSFLYLRRLTELHFGSVFQHVDDMEINIETDNKWNQELENDSGDSETYPETSTPVFCANFLVIFNCKLKQIMRLYLGH